MGKWVGQKKTGKFVRESVGMVRQASFPLGKKVMGSGVWKWVANMIHTHTATKTLLKGLSHEIKQSKNGMVEQAQFRTYINGLLKSLCVSHETLTNPFFLLKTASIDTSYFHLVLPTAAEVALDVMGRQVVQQFHVSNTRDFSCCSWKVEIATQAVFIIYKKNHLLLPLGTRKSDIFNQLETRNGNSEIAMIDQRVLDSGNQKTDIINTSCLQKKQCIAMCLMPIA